MQSGMPLFLQSADTFKGDCDSYSQLAHGACNNGTV